LNTKNIQTVVAIHETTQLKSTKRHGFCFRYSTSWRVSYAR